MASSGTKAGNCIMAQHSYCSSNNKGDTLVTHPAYRNFVNSLHAHYTKRNYVHYFSKYYLLKHDNQGLTLDEILRNDDIYCVPGGLGGS
jgi:hypothetical protein